MNKERILLSVILLLALAGSYLGCKNQNEIEKKIVKFGAILPLTGESAYWGINIKDGINLAIDEINNDGGILNHKIEVIFEDSKGLAAPAISSINKLIEFDKIQFVIGDVISSNILAIAPIVETNKVVLIGFGESAEITQAGDYVFRNWNSAASDATITGTFAAKRSPEIVLLSRNDAFGKSAKKLFKFEVENAKVDVVADIEFDTKSNDFRTIISSFKNKKYTAIYFAGFHKEALEFIKQYIELGGRNIDIYGVSSWEEKTLTDFIVENYNGNVYYGYPKPPDSTSQAVIHFKEAFINRYKQEPQILNDNGYDAVYMLKYAIEESKSFEGEKVKNSLYTLQDFEGASGKFSLDKNGDVNKPFGLKVINSNGVSWYHE